MNKNGSLFGGGVEIKKPKRKSNNPKNLTNYDDIRIENGQFTVYEGDGKGGKVLENLMGTLGSSSDYDKRFSSAIKFDIANLKEGDTVAVVSPFFYNNIQICVLQKEIISDREGTFVLQAKVVDYSKED